MADWRLFAGDALVIVGMVAVTIAVLGILRRGDFMVRLHATSLLAVVVAFTVAAAGIAGAGLETALRALLVCALVVATAPLSAHALGRAWWQSDGSDRRDRDAERPPGHE